MNILPQTEKAVDAVIVTSTMTALEARQCIDEIKAHLNSIRVLLLELDERQGWEALGYQSMRQCMLAEFKRSPSQLHRELKAGKIERVLSPQGDIGLIPEKHLRYIGQLPPERWASAWNEAIATAPPGGVRTTHVAKTVARIKSELTHLQKPEPAANQNVPIADHDFGLGEWVEVRTRNGNATWDGLFGQVTRVEQHEITVQLDGGKWKHLRFYRDELVKVPAPNGELNQIIETAIASTPTKSFYKRGDIVLINCPASAGSEYLRWCGCWGLVKNVGQLGSVEVMVAGETMRFPPSDLEIIDNPSPVFVEVAEKVVRLLKRDDLDACERYLLMGFYLRQQAFTQRQMEMLAYLVDHYENPESVIGSRRENFPKRAENSNFR